MREQGIGGVEICCVWEMYEKGNIPYLSDEWIGMVRFAIEKAAERDMEVAFTFGPGWDLGGSWVPPTERSKVLAPAEMEIDGPADFDGALPEYHVPPDIPRGAWVLDGELETDASDQNAIVAVVAARVNNGAIDPATLTVITSHAEDQKLRWSVPEGRWRIMTYRLRYTGQENSAQNYVPENWLIDHFNKNAVMNYCNHLNGAFNRAFGEYFGNVVDSYFVDSWEVKVLHNSVFWSNSLLDDFRHHKGYDLTPYLPAIWHDIGPLTPHIRYDVNTFMHDIGMERVIRPLVETTKQHGVQARIQPHYRFTTEIMEEAGMTPRPDTEVTTARFATVADPRKATAAAMRLYGGDRFLSAESYTFLNRERYRTTLEEMKRATDAFLRDGVTQFYNHGYVYSPETGPTPSRDIPWANRISHVNTWWRYYNNLAAYIARCCYLLRQGRFAGDVLLYSPQATEWSERANFGNDRRVLNYGNVPQTLIANGYDYDPVNDDLLQNHAAIEDGRIQINGHKYRFLILPAIKAIPPKTQQFIERFVAAGGIVIALESLPAAATGLNGREAGQDLVRSSIDTVKQAPSFHFLPEYKIGEDPFSSNDQTWKPMPPLDEHQQKLLSILREDTPPDFTLEGARQSNGLTHLHRKTGELDVYFITNLSPEAVSENVTFRVKDSWPQEWNPLTGEIRPYPAPPIRKGELVTLPVRLNPWGSTIIVFSNERLPEPKPVPRPAIHLEPLDIKGEWKLTVGRIEERITTLASWTANPATRHFSGTAVYETDFEVSKAYTLSGITLILDLGRVGEVAEVWLNGEQAGVCWMQPYEVEVTKQVKQGVNRLRILATNTLINRIAGMSEPPPVPPELRPHYGAEGSRYATGRQRFEVERKTRLPDSGLLGPVRLIAR